ncbi:MAG: DUF4258 domain-containing protein [Oscillochloridaceae bacterium umkhey_bin13]
MLPLVFRAHAIQRMFERHISVEDVRTVIMAGEVIKVYPDDTPYPSRLMLGWINGRPLHVVAADNLVEQEIIVITAYEPDPNQWEVDFKRRRA